MPWFDHAEDKSIRSPIEANNFPGGPAVCGLLASFSGSYAARIIQ